MGNKANQQTNRQPRSFAAAILAFVSNIDKLGNLAGLLELIAVKHCALGVQPYHYLIVQRNIVDAMEEVLGSSLTRDNYDAWSEAILYLARMLVERERAIYIETRCRNGGWRGFGEFLVLRREVETRDVTTFTFKPLEAGGTYFDFSPGQFLTIKTDPLGDGLTAPRHYTVTSAPGMPFLQASIKKIPGGLVSTHLHDKVREGCEVLLSPPFGTFTSPRSKTATVVFLSAGIGITPMVALLQELGEAVVLAAHIDKNEESHAFRQCFLDAGVQTRVHYTEKSGRPQTDFAAELASIVGVSHEWYICGPGTFMTDALQALVGAGVSRSRIHLESFGPHLCMAG